MEKNTNNKYAYTGESKSKGKKVCFIFPIYIAKITAIKTALKDIYKRENKRWVLLTDLQISM